MKTQSELCLIFEQLLFWSPEGQLSGEFIDVMEALIAFALEGKRVIIGHRTECVVYRQFESDDWGWNESCPRILFPQYEDGGLRMDVLTKFYSLCKGKGVVLYVVGRFGPQKLFS